MSINNQDLSIALTLITIPILVIVWVIWATGRHMGYHAAKRQLASVARQEVRRTVESERTKLLTKGEQVGYEKGLEAGRQEAHQNLQRDFILFLEEQLRLLKNERIDK